MDKQTAKTLLSELQKVAKKIANENSLYLEKTRGTYGNEFVDIKLSFHESDQSTREKKNWNKNCNLYGFKKEDFGKNFTHFGETYKVIGLNTKAKKFPIYGERIKDGKKFKFKAGSINLGEMVN